MHRFLYTLFGCALLPCAFTACGDDSSKPEQGLIKAVTKEISSLRDEVAGHEVTKMADDELQKLEQLEYKVVDLPLVGSPEAITKSLTQLGQDKWDCFEVVPQSEKLRIFCKRRPYTFLRYLQQG